MVAGQLLQVAMMPVVPQRWWSTLPVVLGAAQWLAAADPPVAPVVALLMLMLRLRLLPAHRRAPPPPAAPPLSAWPAAPPPFPRPWPPAGCAHPSSSQPSWLSSLPAASCGGGRSCSGAHPAPGCWRTACYIHRSKRCAAPVCVAAGAAAAVAVGKWVSGWMVGTNGIWSINTGCGSRWMTDSGR